jgi:hypothetical protein
MRWRKAVDGAARYPVGTPVTLRERRRRSVVLMIVCGVFAIAGPPLVVDGQVALGVADLAFFGGGALFFLRVVLMGGLWLRLDERGFTTTNGFVCWTCAWHDVSGFYPITVRGVTLVGFALSPGAPSPYGPLMRALTYAGMSLPSKYGGMNQAEMIEYMEAWRKLYRRSHVALSEAGTL